METTHLLHPDQWAEQTFGQAQLGDRRRTRRAVKAACGMVRDPAASLPKQHHTWRDLKAVYRLLDEPEVTFEALMQPHWQQTRACLHRETVVLLVQDTTEIDLSAHAAMSGLGQIGNAKGRGFLLQTVLAVVPETQAVLGCALQEPFIRRLAPPGEGRDQRRQRRERETDVWRRLVQRLGSVSAQTTLIHVGDRGADMFELFHACRATQTHFLVRAAQNRRIARPKQGGTYLLTCARAWPSQGHRSFEVPASHGRQARSTHLQIAWGPMKVLPPRWEPHATKEPMELWVIHVWEEEPPEGEEPLEWLLLTSVPTATLEQAWERVAWYRCRWVVEEYHQCLKTGCRIEERHVQTAERLIRLLGFLSPIAVRLVQLRDVARRSPEAAAGLHVEPAAVALIAASLSLPPEQVTVARFWQEVARLGGYLGRRRDGPPGWKTLWKGWVHLQAMLEGVHLAAHLRL